MHVMVATDGTLDPVNTAGLAAKLAADGGRVTVFTVVEVPRKLLEEMRDASRIHEQKLTEVSTEYRQETAENPPVTHWMGDDAFVERYVGGKVEDRCDDLATALKTTGVDYEIVGEENEDAARSILKAVDDRDVDVLLIGPHGLGLFEGLLGSISTKLVRRANCSVLVIRE